MWCGVIENALIRQKTCNRVLFALCGAEGLVAGDDKGADAADCAL